VSIQHRLSKASAGLVIAGLHLAGVVVWWSARHGLQFAPDKALPPSVAVWLPALAQPDTKQALRAPRPLEPTASSRQRDNRKPSTPDYIADATTAPSSSGVALPVEARGSTEAQAPSAPALNLTLSRKDIASVAPRSFAEQSPFRGRLPKTVERQIASAAAESGPWVEERIDNDHIRFRRGNTCFTMQRPRAASIDPMNEASARMPWRKGEAEACND